MASGELRIYLGAAPGVGKTYAMLAEGQRRQARGTDVVCGLIETHGRRLTAAMTKGLEIVPRRTMSHRGATFTEMDLDTVLARQPQVALVDELAHTNVPGCRNAKRWQDVDELLDAGIDVITTLNIQHLESLSTVAKQVTGVEQHETLPDEIARRADQIELVDMTPEALRRRMVHGNVYPPNRIDAALTHYFRPGNLTALRELALLWVADRGPGGPHVTLSTAEDLPDVIADAAFLTRILTSLLADAMARSPADAPPALTAVSLGSQVEIRITDWGPDEGDGAVSLPLRLARDLADAMGDTLRCEPSPGGGRTVVMTLSAVARRRPELAIPTCDPAARLTL